MIRIVGLGPGNKDALTMGTLEAFKLCKKVFLRTYKHPTVEYLNEIGIKYETYDHVYDSLDNFNEVYEFIAGDLIKQHNTYGDIIFAVPGHPLVAEKSVNILIKLCQKSNISYEIIPAVSFIDAILECLNLDPVEGFKVIDAFDMKNQILDKRAATIVTQVYNKLIASEVKLRLQDYYNDDTEVYFIRAAGIKESQSIRKIHLYELDRQEDVDYLTSIYIPRSMDNTKDFNDLLEIMSILRGDEGCPWDLEQTHDSLKRYLIEECYEVLEAIDEKDYDMLIEELGDVLLQVVFHAQVGKEDGFFNINDVIKGICHKMIDRHPHIFGTTIVKNSQEVLSNWDEIKKKEKGFETYTEQLKHVPKNLPALMRAEKVQAKAKKVGFDFDKVDDALNKVLEELNELKNVYKGNNKAKIIEELGDLLFSSVNVARFLDIDPENALNYTIDKFINRFDFIEKQAEKEGKSLAHMSLEEMDVLWDFAKRQ